jgi:putative endonuclease
MMFFVYILPSTATGRWYTGSTAAVQDRLRRHNAGESKATRHDIPWTLIRTETFATRAEAVRRERYYKTGRGRGDLDALLNKHSAATQ